MDPLREYPGYGGFLRRFLAGIIDFVLLGIFIVFILFAYILQDLAPHFDRPLNEVFAFSFLWHPLFFCFIFCFLYFIALEASSLGGTIGKILSGIEVCDLKGKPAPLSMIIVRNLMKPFSMLFFALGILIIPLTRRKQAFHDFIAGTLVTNKIPKQLNFKNVYIKSLNRLKIRFKKGNKY